MSDTCSSDKKGYDVVVIRNITIIGALVNVFLAIVKFILGTLGRSQAVIADAVHSLSDLSTDFAVIFGVKYWSKPADEDHPYGHGRIEVLITATIGIALFVVGIGLGYNALSTIKDDYVSQPSWIAFIGALISIIFKEILYHKTIATGKKVRSSAVIANAWHHRSDALSSIPVAIAVAAAVISPKWYFLDYVGAFVVSVFIMYAALKILRSCFCEIADAGASEKEREIIHGLVLSIENVRSTHAIRTRKVGPGWYVDLHIQVDPQMTVHDGHEVSKIVKNKLLSEGPDVLDVIVHLEPDE